MSIEQLRRSARGFIAATTRSTFECPTTEQVAEFYDRNGGALAEIYRGQMHVGYWAGPEDDSGLDQAGARLTDIMISKLGAGPDDRILDLGCGSGAPAVQVARATGAEVVGVSISTGDVELASATAEAEGMADRVRFRHGDALDLPFEPGSFDAVLALESFVHLPDRVWALREIARVLRPGGRVVLTDYIRRGPEKMDEAEEYALAETLADWRMVPMARAEHYPDFARQAGLAVDEITDITEHTKYSFGQIYLATREYARKHGDLPPDLAKIFSKGTDEDWLESAEEPQYNGTVLVVARKADDTATS
ncbi:methyltransferase domain-containing protein [Streptosporangium sp. NPDC002544]|uniref:SAM-dependent methyltransferase n=1 Tax=Streptosporangium sp. NPDC002544 TaxID=3154538 RepID=UPI00331B90B6